MNPWCIDCGSRLSYDCDTGRYSCDCCGNQYSPTHVHQARRPKGAHGIRCGACDGDGYIEVTVTEYHPYGDTVAGEPLADFEDCHECDGRGYHLDDSSCIVCGAPVANGNLRDGWEVHDQCSTDSVPTLSGWDG